MHEYSEAEERKILELRESGLTFKEIASRLGDGFSEDQIRAKYNRLRQQKLNTSELEKQNKVLIRQIELLKQQFGNGVRYVATDDEWYRFGIVSDTHLGSLYEDLDLLSFAYDEFQREGITTVYHLGDFLEGEKLYRGQEYEVHKHGADEQVEHAIAVYPKVDGIKTHFITGNHDMSFWRLSGLSVGKVLSGKRDDLIFLGNEIADEVVEVNGGRVTIRLIHPSRGTAYALSYFPQKYIETLVERKPHLVLIGHFHKAEYMFYRGTHVLQASCLQFQTPYMQRKSISAIRGFWIMELNGRDCKQRFYPGRVVER